MWAFLALRMILAVLRYVLAVGAHLARPWVGTAAAVAIFAVVAGIAFHTCAFVSSALVVVTLRASTSPESEIGHPDVWLALALAFLLGGDAIDIICFAGGTCFGKRSRRARMPMPSVGCHA